MTTVPMTYTPALCQHLEDLRQSWESQKRDAFLRIKYCSQDGDEDGIKIAQIDLSVAIVALDKVMEHLARANEEWTR